MGFSFVTCVNSYINCINFLKEALTTESNFAHKFTLILFTELCNQELVLDS